MKLVSNRASLFRASINILIMSLFHKCLRRKSAETTLAELSQERNIQRESYCPSSLVLRRIMNILFWIVLILVVAWWASCKKSVVAATVWMFLVIHLSVPRPCPWAWSICVRVFTSRLEANNYGLCETENCEIKLFISISPRSDMSDLIYRKKRTYDCMHSFGLSQSCGVFCFRVHK